MIRYFTTRLLYYGSIFLGLILFSFVLFHVVPSDPARTILGPNADHQQVLQLRKQLGLDRPLPDQLVRYVEDVARFDFGHSFVDQRNVLQEVSRRLSVTLFLVTITTCVIVIYLFFVILSFQIPRLKIVMSKLEFLMSSVPVFFSGIIVALFVLYFYPITAFSGDVLSLSNLLFLIPPSLVLSFYPLAILSGIIKQELPQVLESAFIIAGKSIGFSDTAILFRYGLKNILIPVLSTFSNILPMLLTGAFIVEIIFTIPGIGSLLIKSILDRDFPMIECMVIVNGAFFVLINLFFEYIYPVIDPRVIKT